MLLDYYKIKTIFKVLGSLLVSFVFLILLFDKVVMPLYIHHNNEVVLPDIVGKKYDDAESLLKSKDLRLIIEDKKPDDTYPPDVVLIQNPKGNSVVREGRRVYVTLSSLENPVIVPSLIGDSEREARIKISNSEMKIGFIEMGFSSFFAVGVVINQSPLSGTKVSKGDKVNITVSIGNFPDEIIVPDIEGKNLEIAENEIKKTGLKIGNIYTIVKNDLLPNTVLGMGYKNEPISSGTPLKPGDSIDIIISKIDTSFIDADSIIFN